MLSNKHTVSFHIELFNLKNEVMEINNYTHNSRETRTLYLIAVYLYTCNVITVPPTKLFIKKTSVAWY